MIQRRKGKTKERIFRIAVEMAESGGLENITREKLAMRAGVFDSAVSWHFDSMAHLRACIIRHAIEHRLLKIVAYAVVTKHPLSKTVGTELRTAALAAQQ